MKFNEVIETYWKTLNKVERQKFIDRLYDIEKTHNKMCNYCGMSIGGKKYITEKPNHNYHHIYCKVKMIKDSIKYCMGEINSNNQAISEFDENNKRMTREMIKLSKEIKELVKKYPDEIVKEAI